MVDIKSFVKQTRFETIDDMLQAYYGPATNYITKVAPLLTDTAGVRNIIYGSKLWVEIAYSANAFGALPKKAWDHSGYRMLSAAGATTTMGIAEGAAPPITIKPTMVPVDITPKLLASTYEMSLMEVALEGKDDTLKWADISDYMTAEFKNRADRGLFVTIHTLAGTNIESIDRVCGAKAEIAGETLDAGDADIYGLDRDSPTTYDAYVNMPASGHAERALALNMVDSLFSHCRPYWESASYESKMLLTGYDTLERMEQLLQPQQRFNEKAVQFGVNGVQTVKGVEGGFDVATYKGVPIIPDQNCLVDTISRVYLLDLDRVGVAMAAPPQHIESEDPILIDYFMRRALDFMFCELVSTGFHCHGKVRDLS